MNGVNLIPAARSEQARRRARARVWGLVCAVCAIGLAVGAASFRIVRTIDPAGIRSQIDAAAARADAAELELARLEARARELTRALEAARIVGVHPDWSVLLRAVNTARGDSVALESVELLFSPVAPPAAPAGSPASTPPTPRERYTLRLRGVATSVQDVTRFVTALEAIGVTERVWLKGTSAQTVRGVAVSGFEIECTLAERESPRVEASP
jgi:Tfp pilus assembly protein PilN